MNGWLVAMICASIASAACQVAVVLLLHTNARERQRDEKRAREAITHFYVGDAEIKI